MNKTIIIFAKYPAPGAVKTRLARSVGNDHALSVYKALLDDTFSALKSSRFPVYVFYTPDNRQALNYFQSLTWEGCTLAPQKGENLGQRMSNACKTVFQKQVQKALLIGSDTPGLGPALFREAFASLDKNDVTIGPSRDGGYYLIGFNESSFHEMLFQEMTWSTERVFDQTLDRLRSASLSFKILKTLNDIDDFDDLASFAQENKGRSALDAFLLSHPDIL